MSITVNEAGRKGGLTVLRNRGRTFFVEIGSKGQAATRQKYPGMARKWGRMGGRPKKPPLEECGGDRESQLQKGGKGPAL